MQQKRQATKRVELTEEEQSILRRVLTNWLRRYRGRARYAWKACSNLELQAKDWESRHGMANVAQMRRDLIPGWQQKALESQRAADVTRLLLDRLNTPDDPNNLMLSQKVIDGLKAGRHGVVKDESGEDLGALVPLDLYRLLQTVMKSLAAVPLSLPEADPVAIEGG